MIHSFCLLTSMELIPIPNCKLLYLHSNDMKSLKSLFLKKKKSYGYDIKTKNNWLNDLFSLSVSLVGLLVQTQLHSCIVRVQLHDAIDVCGMQILCVLATVWLRYYLLWWISW